MLKRINSWSEALLLLIGSIPGALVNIIKDSERGALPSSPLHHRGCGQPLGGRGGSGRRHSPLVYYLLTRLFVFGSVELCRKRLRNPSPTFSPARGSQDGGRNTSGESGRGRSGCDVMMVQ